MLHRLLTLTVALAVLLTGSLALAPAPDAAAAWRLTSAATPAMAKATAIAAQRSPTVRGVDLGTLGYRYTVSWPASAMMNGQSVTGYLVTRMSPAVGGGTSALAGGTCAGISILGLGAGPAVPHAASAIQSCTDDSLVNLGAVKYQITPVYGNWRGQPSTWVTTT